MLNMCSKVDLFHLKPHRYPPIISFAYGVILDRNVFERILCEFLTPPHPHVRVGYIGFFKPLPPYSYVRFHFVFQHNKMLEKDQLH